MSIYVKNIKDRSKWKYLKGFIPRFKKHVVTSYINWVARKNGAKIGVSVTIPYSLAKKANSNLIIGDHSSIQTDLIDMRIPIKIGNYVIIGSGVEIITVSHNIDSTEWEPKKYGIEIEDYCWLATRSFILPSCRKLGYGSVCAAGSVIVSNAEAMSVMVGNPAKKLRERKSVHSDLCVESLLGNDFIAYKKARSTTN